MKFKLLKLGLTDSNCYGQIVSSGGTITLEGRLAEKAQNNPDFIEVKVTRKKAVKKK